MRRLLLTIAALAILLPTGRQACAWGGFWHRMEVDFNRNQCWPEPFNQVDEASVRDPFAVMVANGWQRQHTMDAYHFNRETHQLTQQGRQKLQLILTQTPPERRTVFVLGDIDPQITRARIDSVQQATASIVSQGPLPQILVSNTAPRGMPASQVVTIHGRAQESAPDPVLPEMQSAGSGQ